MDLGHFGADLGHFGVGFGQIWGNWGTMGQIWGILRRIWGISGQICGSAGVPLSRRGGLRGHMWGQRSRAGSEVTLRGGKGPTRPCGSAPHCVRGVEGGWGVGGWFGDGGFAPELRRCPAAPAPIPGARPGPPGARSGPPEAPQRERGRPPPPPCWWSRGVASLRRDARRTEMTSEGGSGRATRRRLERPPRSSGSEWRMRDRK